MTAAATGKRTRVVIAEDSVLLREGITRLLEESGFEVAGQAGDAEDLLRKVGAHKPDVAVIDVRMPPTHTDEGLRAARRIRAEHPGTAVLVLSQYAEEAYALDLLSESTERTGYLLKDRIADIETFTDAVQRVADGGSALDPEVVALLLGRRRRQDPLAPLTPREREVLGLMAEGRSNSAMADALVVSERAVEKHVTAIFSKLDLPRAGKTTAVCSRCWRSCAPPSNRLRAPSVNGSSDAGALAYGSLPARPEIAARGTSGSRGQEVRRQRVRREACASVTRAVAGWPFGAATAARLRAGRRCAGAFFGAVAGDELDADRQPAVAVCQRKAERGLAGDVEDGGEGSVVEELVEPVGDAWAGSS